MNFVGDITFYDRANGLKATIIMDYSKKKGYWKKTRTGRADEFEGVIYKIDRTQFEKAGFHKKRIYEWEHPKSLAEIKDKGEEVSTITGSWLKEITFDSEQYWELGDRRYKLWPQRASKSPLPSDWRYREDLIWLKYKNEPYADAWKKELEIMQRLDRKWRKAKK